MTRKKSPNKDFSILLATSDDLTKERLVDILSKRNYHFEVVDSYTGAIEILMDHNFDLVIFDPALKAMTGHEALKLIKKIHPKTPIIVTSDEKSYEAETKIASIGVYFRLGKPVDEKITRELVRNLEAKEN